MVSISPHVPTPYPRDSRSTNLASLLSGCTPRDPPRFYVASLHIAACTGCTIARVLNSRGSRLSCSVKRGRQPVAISHAPCNCKSNKSWALSGRWTWFRVTARNGGLQSRLNMCRIFPDLTADTGVSTRVFRYVTKYVSKFVKVRRVP